MISKIDLKEIFSSFDSSLITIDLTNKNLQYLKNEVVMKNERININCEELTDLIKIYITYWDNEYIDNTIVDGTEIELSIYTDDEIIKYNFKNKYPYNYNEFIKYLKAMVNII